MGVLFETIRRLVLEGRYVIGEHASDRLEERGIMEWQVVAGMESAVRIIENVNAKPNPTVELREILPNGASVKVVWSLLYRSKVAKLVTVHFFDGDS